MGISDLKIKLFADGSDFKEMMELYANPFIKGFTTNPTLMKRADITDYEGFAHLLIEHIPDRPISLEVFADEFDEMERQARKIASWGENVYVKIPITNTRSESSRSLIRTLSRDGIKVNVTAIMTSRQAYHACEALYGGADSYISVFAGRIADTGRDPITVMQKIMSDLLFYPSVELIWASPRELLNIFQADALGVHILTATSDIIKKLPLINKNLDEYSLETVKMFRDDARKAGYVL